MGSLNLYLFFFVIFFLWDQFLIYLNQKYYRNKDNQTHAKKKLAMSDEDFTVSEKYTDEMYNFSKIYSAIYSFTFVGFLLLGGISLFEKISHKLAHLLGSSNEVIVGMIFFFLLILAAKLLSLPFSYYVTFYLEEKFGHNKTTKKLFFVDKIKLLAVESIIQLIVVAVLVSFIGFTSLWWLYGWIFYMVFQSILVVISPSLISPLFNKFSALPAGELRDELKSVATKAKFPLKNIKSKNASIRSTHGNAYFTGLFGKKSIVLYDTLIEKLSIPQVAAILAHEIGHYKHQHVLKILSIQFTLLLITLFLVSFFVQSDVISQSFGFSGSTGYSTLLLVVLWISVFDKIISPTQSFISRKFEFQADRYANFVYDGKELITGLKKLTTDSKYLPISHPLFSAIHYSHPPLIERIDAINANLKKKSNS